jgi:hypothetical protein
MTPDWRADAQRKFADTKRAIDLPKLAQAFFAYLRRNSWEYGSIGLDIKRPFGSGDVEADILGIIGAAMEGDDGEGSCWSSSQLKYAADLYDGLIPYLQKTYLKDQELVPDYLRPDPTKY